MANTFKNWDNGLPSEGVQLDANPSGGQKYWWGGLPSQFSFIASVTGTNIKLNIGAVWKTVSGIQLNIGGTWKTVTSAKVNIGDVWKTIF